jgi:hypothetical protein
MVCVLRCVEPSNLCRGQKTEKTFFVFSTATLFCCAVAQTEISQILLNIRFLSFSFSFVLGFVFVFVVDGV